MKRLYFDGMRSLVRVKPIRVDENAAGNRIYIVEAREDAGAYRVGDIIEASANWLVNKSPKRGTASMMCTQADVSLYF